MGRRQQHQWDSRGNMRGNEGGWNEAGVRLNPFLASGVAVTSSPNSIYSTNTSSTPPASKPPLDVNTIFESIKKIDWSRLSRPEQLQTQPSALVHTIVLATHHHTLKKRQESIIEQLYSGVQCQTCGVRFSREKLPLYKSHLDWHFR